MAFLSSYQAVLRTPHAYGAFVTSLVGRLSYGIVSLSLILTLTADGRGYGFTGFVMALFFVPVKLYVKVAPQSVGDCRVEVAATTTKGNPIYEDGFAALVEGLRAAVNPTRPRSRSGDQQVEVYA